MSLSIKGFLVNLPEKLLSVQETIANKAYLLAGWIASGSITANGLIGADGRTYFERVEYFFVNITLMESLGLLAMILLIIERIFTVWARWREHRRNS